MIKREYGKTGKMISVVGFGGMRFKEADYKDDPERGADLIRYAHEKGINFFDTAPRYCQGESERVMGRAFGKMDRDSFVISSKVITTDPSRNAENTYDLVRTSLDKLQVSKLDILHAWCIKTPEQYEFVMKKGGIYEGMLKAKAEGLVDVLSMSTHMGGDDIANVAKNDPDAFDGVLLGYNALNYAYRNAGISAFAELGKGIVIMNPLGGGLITENVDMFQYLARGGDDAITGALKFLTSQTRITSALSGMTSFEEIDNNVLAGENLYPNDEIMDAIANNKIEGGLNDVCTLCSYCNHCPIGLSPHKMMSAYNQKLLKNDLNYTLGQITMHFGVDEEEVYKCIECGKCESLCTQKLPIIQRIKDLQKMFDAKRNGTLDQLR